MHSLATNRLLCGEGGGAGRVGGRVPEGKGTWATGRARDCGARDCGARVPSAAARGRRGWDGRKCPGAIPEAQPRGTRKFPGVPTGHSAWVPAQPLVQGAPVPETPPEGVQHQPVPLSQVPRAGSQSPLRSGRRGRNLVRRPGAEAASPCSARLRVPDSVRTAASGARCGRAGLALGSRRPQPRALCAAWSAGAIYRERPGAAAHRPAGQGTGAAASARAGAPRRCGRRRGHAPRPDAPAVRRRPLGPAVAPRELAPRGDGYLPAGTARG